MIGRSNSFFGSLRRRKVACAILAASFASGCASPRDNGNPASDRAIAEPVPHTPSALHFTSAETAVRTATDDVELSRFVPPGATLRMSARDDLDGDGDEDALIAVEHGGVEASDIPRALYLLRRDTDGVLQLAVDSPKAIPCRTCGGMMGDPLQSIRTGRGRFTLRFEGGSRELWSSEYSFEYVPDRDGWRLAGIAFGSFDRADGKSAQRSRGPADLGDVPLAAFDPDDFPADAGDSAGI